MNYYEGLRKSIIGLVIFVLLIAIETAFHPILIAETKSAVQSAYSTGFSYLVPVIILIPIIVAILALYHFIERK